MSSSQNVRGVYYSLPLRTNGFLVRDAPKNCGTFVTSRPTSFVLVDVRGRFTTSFVRGLNGWINRDVRHKREVDFYKGWDSNGRPSKGSRQFQRRKGQVEDEKEFDDKHRPLNTIGRNVLLFLHFGNGESIILLHLTLLLSAGRVNRLFRVLASTFPIRVSFRRMIVDTIH